MEISKSRSRMVGVLGSLLVVVAAAAFFALRQDSQTDEETPSREEVSAANSTCFTEALEADRYDPGALDETYATCLDDRLDISVTEVDDIVSPVSELPACDDLWSEVATWNSEEETYGWECRYGTGDGKRYEADVDVCFGVKKVDGWLVVGPDDLYIFRGGLDGWDSTVGDGSAYSEYAGQFGVDVARDVCANT